MFLFKRPMNAAQIVICIFYVCHFTAAQMYISGLRNGFLSTICLPSQKEFLLNGHFIKLKIKKYSLKCMQHIRALSA